MAPGWVSIRMSLLQNSEGSIAAMQLSPHVGDFSASGASLCLQFQLNGIFPLTPREALPASSNASASETLSCIWS
jgi:hypothetical protein